MDRARYRRRMAAVVAVVLLLPGSLYAAGVRSSQFENHALAPFPTADSGWDYFRDLGTWTTDNIPLRQQGIQANNWIDRNIFDDPPGSNTGGGPAGPGVPGFPSASNPGLVYPTVLYGQDGYLFYGGDIRLKCEPTRTMDQILQAVDDLADAVRDSGRAFVLLVAPDKSTIAADRLPGAYLGSDCASERSLEMQQRLADVDYAPDLFTLLAQAAAVEPDVYLPLDTHWNGRGAAVFTRTLVTALNPEIAPSLDERQRPDVRRQGDLTVLAGRPQYMDVEQYVLHSPSITANWLNVDPISASPLLYTADGPPGTQVAGSTLLIGDSFIDSPGADLPYFFEQSVKIQHWAAGSDPDGLVRELIASDSVVVEMVERDFASGNSPLFDPSFVDAAVSALARNPR